MMSRLQNPTKNRLHWIIDNYPWETVKSVIIGLDEALGIHERLEVLMMFDDTSSINWQDEVKNSRWVSDLDGNSEFDKHLNWFAKEDHKARKRFSKIRKEYKNIKTLYVPTDVKEEFDLERSRFETAIIAIKERLGPISKWATANNIDLNQYSIFKASEESSSWEVEVTDMSQAEIVFKFKDGYTIQELTTKRQVEDEGEVMQHCIGGYDEKTLGGALYSIYSLRDENGKPHITIEYDHGVETLYGPGKRMFSQIKGKQNQNLRPSDKYAAYILEWLYEILIENEPEFTDQPYLDFLQAVRLIFNARWGGEDYGTKSNIKPYMITYSVSWIFNSKEVVEEFEEYWDTLPEDVQEKLIEVLEDFLSEIED